MTNYTAADGTIISVTTLVTITDSQGTTTIFQAVYSGLSDPSGLVDQGIGTTTAGAVTDLYQSAHRRRLSGMTPDLSTWKYR